MYTLTKIIIIGCWVLLCQQDAARVADTTLNTVEILPEITYADLGARCEIDGIEFVHLQYSSTNSNDEEPAPSCLWIAADRITTEHLKDFVFESTYDGGDDFLLAIRVWKRSHDDTTQAWYLRWTDAKAFIDWFGDQSKLRIPVRLPSLIEYRAFDTAIRSDLSQLGFDGKAFPGEWEEAIPERSYLTDLTLSLYKNPGEWINSSIGEKMAANLLGIGADNNIIKQSHRAIFSRRTAEPFLITVGLIDDATTLAAIRLAVDCSGPGTAPIHHLPVGLLAGKDH